MGIFISCLICTPQDKKKIENEKMKQKQTVALQEILCISQCPRIPLLQRYIIAYYCKNYIMPFYSVKEIHSKANI